MSRLLIRPSPQADESLPSIVVRTGKANALTASEIIAYAGLEPYALATLPSSPEHAGKLAKLFDLPEAGIEARLYVPDGPARFRIRGTSFARMDVRTSYRQFSPAALARDNYHRIHWDLAILVADPHTGETLLDRCPNCEGRVRWHAEDYERCIRCGTHLARTKSHPAPEHEIAFSRAVLGLLGWEEPEGAALSPRLQALNLEELILALRHLGRLSALHCGAIADGDDPLRLGVKLALGTDSAFDTVVERVVSIGNGSDRFGAGRMLDSWLRVQDDRLPKAVRGLFATSMAPGQPRTKKPRSIRDRLR